MEFQRARTDEQRNERRNAILETAAAMLAEMSVAAVSLNELSRRVGLAKSNVMRYFESREAILLELLDAELATWAVEVEREVGPSDAPAHERGSHLAATLATSLARRPVMCDLISAQAAVLERNISMEVALRHKRRTAQTVGTLIEAITRQLPELNVQAAYHLVATTLLMTSGAWPQSLPSEALLAAYAADPEIAAQRMDFAEFLKRTLGVTICGLLACQEIPASS